ncbi:MAG: hypothetical protein AB7N76_34030 [Planctomycetota bacterium]
MLRLAAFLASLLLLAAPAAAREPVHETISGLLRESNRTGALARVLGKRFYKASDRAWAVEIKRGKESLSLRWTEYDAERNVTQTTCTISLDGKVQRYTYSEGRHDAPQPARQARGALAGDGVFRLEAQGFQGKRRRVLPWPDDCAPTPLVLFLVAPLWDQVPGGGRGFRLLTGLELEKAEVPSYFDPNRGDMPGGRKMTVGMRYELVVEEAPPERRGRILSVLEGRRERLLVATEEEVERFLGAAPRPKPSPSASPTPSATSSPRPSPSPRPSGSPTVRHPGTEPPPTAPAQPDRPHDATVEAEGIQHLRGLNALQQLFREGDKDKNGDLDYAPDLATLKKALGVPGELASSASYRYRLRRSSKHPEFEWMAVAEPSGPKGRYLAIDARGRVVASGQPIPLPDTAQLPERGVTTLIAPGDDPATRKLRENEHLADITLTAIQRMQIVFALKDKDGNGVKDYAPDLATLVKHVDPRTYALLARGEQDGYRFRLMRSEQAPTTLWLVVAEPLEPGKSGRLYFAMNQDGRLHRREEGPYELNPACEIKPAK